MFGRMMCKQTHWFMFTLVSYLLREDIVGEENHTGAVSDEVGDRFHDIPSKHIPAHTQKNVCIYSSQQHLISLPTPAVLQSQLHCTLL